MSTVASLLFAAGRGTRMKGYFGNKTLLPLIPAKSPYQGARPLIREVLDNLPAGPRGIVVNYDAEQVRRATEGQGISFVYQPVSNGTGGALLAARSFLNSADADRVIVTMGDVPLIRSATYYRLLDLLGRFDLTLLAFESKDRGQYGMIEMEGQRVTRIVEWKYWKDFPLERQSRLRYCNAGVYAAGKTTLLRYLDQMEKRPHDVRKQQNGQWITIKEYFLTDLAEMMNEDGLLVGMTPTPEEEVVGVDTLESLEAVQKLYARLQGSE
ncbi:MAG: NTP transferase domain-containing protein [Syntrophobacteraceae bacterium]|jgi:bifunctional N-acetylglucosamine-1-phosphate-uridyltransferase/glucosamine-1-phosphate-acetyltransferase GlmU-like protein